MSVDTSAAGRVQLSDENAYRVSAVMPQPGAISTARRPAAGPAGWRATRGRPRRVAQGPLPSMTIATWKEVLCFIKPIRKKKTPPSACPAASRVDQRFHVIEIALERPPAEGGESVFGLGNAPLERFGADDVFGILELARVHAQIAVGCLQERFQLVERETLTHRQRAHDREPHPLVYEAVQVRGSRLDFGFHRSFRVRAGEPRR